VEPTRFFKLQIQFGTETHHTIYLYDNSFVMLSGSLPGSSVASAKRANNRNRSCGKAAVPRPPLGGKTVLNFHASVPATMVSCGHMKLCTHTHIHTHAHTHTHMHIHTLRTHTHTHTHTYTPTHTHTHTHPHPHPHTHTHTYTPTHAHTHT